MTISNDPLGQAIPRITKREAKHTPSEVVQVIARVEQQTYWQAGVQLYNMTKQTMRVMLGMSAPELLPEGTGFPRKWSLAQVQLIKVLAGALLRNIGSTPHDHVPECRKALDEASAMLQQAREDLGGKA